MSTKKYMCNLCDSGTTKSYYENHGCCAKCKDKIEKAKKDGKCCGICKLIDNELFIKFNGLCMGCNNKRCGLIAENKPTNSEKQPEIKHEPEGNPSNDSESEKESYNKKEIVDELLSRIVQAYAEMGLDESVSKAGFISLVKTTIDELLENELNS